MNTVWSYVLQVGSISGLLSLAFNITQGIKKTPRFKYDFQGSSTKTVDAEGKPIEENGLTVCTKTFQGIVSNQSQDPNSLKCIYVVVWGNRNRTSCRSMGTANKIIDVTTGNPVNLPRTFAAREGINVTVEHKIMGWDKSNDKELLTAHTKIPGTDFLHPVYTYVLAFEDINGNLFDQDGQLRNRKEIDLRWTLPNSLKGVEHGITWEYLKHYFRIYKSKSFFVMKKALFLIGLWR